MAQAATLNASIFSDNSQFAFDDDPTNIEFPAEKQQKMHQIITNISKPRKLSHSSIGGSSLNSDVDVHKTCVSSSRVVDIHDTLQKIAKDIHVTGFESSVVVTGLKNARVYTQLSELPWRADFRIKKTNIKRHNPTSVSQRHSSKVESIERQRAGSGPQYPGSGEPIVSGSSGRPTRKLAEGVGRPLRQDSFSANEAVVSRRQKEPRPPSAVTTEGDDEVFYKENAHDTKHCPYYYRHPSDPHGARKLGVSSYADLQQPPYRYSHVTNSYDVLRSLDARMKDWEVYARRLQRRSEKDRMAAYEEREKQYIVDYCMQKHHPSSCSLLVARQTCRFSRAEYATPSSGGINSAEISDPTPLPVVRKSPTRRRTRRSSSAAAAERMPFMSAGSNKANHVTFSVSANRQMLMNLVKNIHPTFTRMMKDLLTKPDCDDLIVEFRKELSKRLKLLKKRLNRLQSSLVNAVGERREKLEKDLVETNRDLRLHENILAKLEHEMDDHGSDGELSESPAPTHRRRTVGQRPQNNPRELNAIRILQRVFGTVD